MRPPPEAKIYAPEFPPRMDWINVAFLRMNTLMGRGAVLIEFWDFARVNSLRTMPYLKAWHERYAEAGLRVIGIHSPGYSFGRDTELVARAVQRLELPYAVLVDSGLEVWHLYGNKGWPGRYLFDRTGKLVYIHYGEGEYLETELAIQEYVGVARDPMEPVRPEDAPGALLEPQTADIALPGGPRAPRAGPRLARRRGLDRGRRRGRGGLVFVSGRRRLRGALGRGRGARALRSAGHRRGRLSGPEAARRAVLAVGAGR